MRRVYICHPYRNDPEGNIEKVRQIVDKLSKAQVKEMTEWAKDVKFCFNLDAKTLERQFDFVCPVSPMLAFTEAMNEPSGGATEAQSMAFCLCLLNGCDEIWVYSNSPTKGMREEITFASEIGIKVVWKA